MIDRPGKPRTIELETPDLVARFTADLFVREASECIAAKGAFFVALAGGTTPLAAYRLLAEPPRRESVDWTHVHVFFGDERAVPAGHPDRNDAAARLALLDRVPIPGENVHAMDAESADGAERYEAELRRVLGGASAEIPSFDLVLLGMGPDGHTASLFPGHEALTVTDRLVVAISGSPKPPSSRVTFTIPLLARARMVAFVVTGKDKAPALARCIAGDPGIPAGLVVARAVEEGVLLFIVDRAALPSEAETA